MFPFLSPYLPEKLTNNAGFMEWLNTPNLMDEFAGMLMMVLPGDRLSYYRTADVAKMRSEIYDYTNEIVDTLGFYPVLANNALLDDMQIYNFAILFIGLVFDIVLILFIVISVLLIYSLLMITTETKTFDIGIMRLIGLSSSGFVAMIFTQAVMFVIPSIICAYICSFPTLLLIFNKMFKHNLSQNGITVVPSGMATLEAVGVGLLIPALSSIIPI